MKINQKFMLQKAKQFFIIICALRESSIQPMKAFDFYHGNVLLRVETNVTLNIFFLKLSVMDAFKNSF